MIGSLAYYLTVVLACWTMSAAEADTDKIKVSFYGEAECPYCREFVTRAWPQVYNDTELRGYIDYDFVAWGNAYYATKDCGKGPYKAQERACWFNKCVAQTSDDDKACFGGHVVSQHGDREGHIDIYENCVKEHYGIEKAVDFMQCVEGPLLDTIHKSENIMTLCLKSVPDAEPHLIKHCFNSDGKAMQMKAAKATPEHAGVPHVLVDGKSIDDPMAIKDVICKKLSDMGVKTPKACAGKVKVEYYGETLNDDCSDFITKAWRNVWNDTDLKSHINYDFVTWGNAYFPTSECGSGPFNDTERECWADLCVTNSTDDEEVCFGGKAIYENGFKEGKLDIFAMCVKKQHGLEAGVTFLDCVESSKHDHKFNTESLAKKCIKTIPNAKETDLFHCLLKQGHDIQVQAARQTPAHDTIPYVLVDGQPLDNATQVLQGICDALKARGIDQPKSCAKVTTSEYYHGLRG